MKYLKVSDLAIYYRKSSLNQVMPFSVPFPGMCYSTGEKIQCGFLWNWE